MSGWRTTPEVIGLSDAVIEMLDAATPEVRRHAWHWISFHVNIEHELEENGSGWSLDDDDIQWLRQHPERYKRNKDVKRRLVESLEKRLEMAKVELQRMGEDV